MILRVALPTPLYQYFDYLAPETLALSIEIGCRVRVSFRQKSVVGIVAEIAQSTSVAADKLKTIEALLDTKAVLDKTPLFLARWAAHYYFYPEGEALLQALPALLRKGEAAHFPHEQRWHATTGAHLNLLPTRAVKLRETLALLLRMPDGVSDDVLKLESCSSASLKKLAEKGLAEQRQHHPQPQHSNDCHPSDFLKESPLPLNDEQQKALQQLFGKEGYRAVLLEGVTGSGKTEVYLQAIEKVLSHGQQAMVLVPEIGLTPQTLARFQARFRVPIVALHSGLSDRQRLNAWLMAREGIARIIIGTRSAIYTPLKNPGVIILDEEHDLSFKQQDGFRYSARDLAVLRAHFEHIPIMLGSATPSLESLHNVDQGRYQHAVMLRRAGHATLPRFELLDIRHQPLHCGISEALIDAIKQHLQQGSQVLIFLNRRGFSPSLICHHCGYVNECTRCDARMTLHSQPPHMHCHHCDRQTPIPLLCQQCGSRDLRPSGAGTERAEVYLQQRFESVNIYRIDRDSTARKEAMKKVLHSVHSGEPCILLGTQMLAKGHHFPNVTLVAVLDADSGLFSADIRGMEKTAQLVLQVAGRAGRAEKSGVAVLQTRHPQHPTLLTLIQNGYQAFAREELRLREQVGLPPYRFHALIRAEATKAGWAEVFLRDIRTALDAKVDPNENLTFSGPYPAPMEKRAGLYRSQLLLQSRQRKPLHAVLTLALNLMTKHKAQRRIRWSIDVDPLEGY